MNTSGMTPKAVMAQISGFGRRWQGLLLISCLLLLATFIHKAFAQEQAGTAADPNQQPGQCGPYYIWYQTGPDEFSSPADYVDLYSITFDIQDVIDDFDFVYFTGSKRSLDANHDGISDQHFYMVDGNQLKWIPTNGRVRITQRGCWSSIFNDRCGYAMISIQPKSWFQNGSARIPIHITKKCSPTGADCSETHLVVHEYSNCEVRSLPDFIIRKEINDDPIIDAGRYVFRYGITIENTTDQPKTTTLTDSMTSISHGGQIYLDYFNVECPQHAVCQLQDMDNMHFTVELRDIPSHEEVKITYHMTVDVNSIPDDQKTYFTNTATLSTGGSSQVTKGIEGKGEGRIERPRQ